MKPNEYVLFKIVNDEDAEFEVVDGAVRRVFVIAWLDALVRCIWWCGL